MAFGAAVGGGARRTATAAAAAAAVVLLAVGVAEAPWQRVRFVRLPQPCKQRKKKKKKKNNNNNKTGVCVGGWRVVAIARGRHSRSSAS